MGMLTSYGNKLAIQPKEVAHTFEWKLWTLKFCHIKGKINWAVIMGNQLLYLFYSPMNTKEFFAKVSINYSD